MDFSLLLNIQDLFHHLPAYINDHYDVTGFLTTLASWSSMLGVLLTIVVMLTFSLFYKYGKRQPWNPSGKLLTTAFLLVWLAGFVIYDLGLYIGNNRLSLLGNAPIAIIHAFKMFLLESDDGAFHTPFHNNVIFMAAFSIIHLLAACITLVFVIKHFGFNIIAGFRMLFESHFSSSKESFILWGMNDASYLLANSIKDHYADNKNYRIIIVRTNHDNENTSVKNGMERLFNFLSLKNNDLNRLIELDCLTTSTYSDLAHQTTAQIDNTTILKKQMGLRQLARIIKKKSKGKLHLFFLSDDTKENILSVANLKKDQTVNEYASSGDKVLFYCQARYNSIHRVIEDENGQSQENIEVRVVDPSHISIELIKQQPDLQPVNYVDIKPDATVSSDFNALVIGFDEVGYDAVRFLYEFGSFVKTGSTDDHVTRSGFHSNVVDKGMDKNAGTFVVNAPSVSNYITFNDNTPTADTMITLHDMDPDGVDFYQHLEKWVENLNYVVVALDDDVKNVSLAVRVFRLAARYRKDLNHFRVLALVRHDEDGYLSRVIEHYNRLWAAEAHCESPSRRTHQKTIHADEHIHEPITLFGSLVSTYTYEYIVSDELTNQAKRFKERYDRSTMNIQQGDSDRFGDILSWEGERKDLMQLSDEYKGFSPTFSGVMRLRRIQRQNQENCFHLFTKRMLAKAALGNKALQLLNVNELSRKKNETTYTCQNHEADPAVTRVLDVLAQTEHLRWIASHEILGYREGDDEEMKDETRLLHGCLKPWQELSTIIKSYDYNVVDVSLGISMEPESNEDL